jgi:hypothetical protein
MEDYSPHTKHPNTEGHNVRRLHRESEIYGELKAGESGDPDLDDSTRRFLGIGKDGKFPPVNIGNTTLQVGPEGIHIVEAEGSQ